MQVSQAHAQGVVISWPPWLLAMTASVRFQEKGSWLSLNGNLDLENDLCSGKGGGNNIKIYNC